jgi:hypothetical protein
MEKIATPENGCLFSTGDDASSTRKKASPKIRSRVERAALAKENLHGR